MIHSTKKSRTDQYAMKRKLKTLSNSCRMITYINSISYLVALIHNLVLHQEPVDINLTQPPGPLQILINGFQFICCNSCKSLCLVHVLRFVSFSCEKFIFFPQFSRLFSYFIIVEIEDN